MSEQNHKRGRKANGPAEVIDVKPSAAAIAEGNHAVAVLSPQDQEILDRFGDGLPYDCTRLVDEARFFIDHAARAMLEVGRRLVLIKQHETTEVFIDVVENQLGMGERSARMYMQASAKLLAARLRGHSTQQLEALGKAKIFALACEDNEVMDAFLEGGTLAGLKFDDVQTMSVREFKTALAEERKQKEAKDKVIKDKDAKINELSESLHRLTSAEPDKLEAEQLEQLGAVMKEVDIKLLSAVATAAGVMEKAVSGTVELQARHSIRALMQRLVDACMKYGFGIDMVAEVDPFWLADIKDAAQQGMAVEEQKRAARAAARKRQGTAS